MRLRDEDLRDFLAKVTQTCLTALHPDIRFRHMKSNRLEPFKTGCVAGALGILATGLCANAAVEFTTPQRTLLDTTNPTVVAIELTSSAPLNADTQIPVTIGPSTAVQGVDFGGFVPAVFFPAGATNTFLRILLLGNPAAADERNLTLQLGDPPAGVEIGRNSRLVITLRSTFTRSYYSFLKAQYHVNESAGTATIWVKQLAASPLQGSTDYSVEAGTAAPGDATLRTGNLSFDSSGLAAFTVDIRDDLARQGDRYLQLSLPSSPGQPEGLVTEAQLVIVDNDGVVAEPIALDRYQKGGQVDVFSVAFYTRPGFLYVVEWSESVAGTAWSRLQTIIGDGEIHSANDIRPISETPNRFYRFRLEDDPVSR